jgi:ABC-type dipeptide/oligopeptide/nickel transport system permease subunit
MIEVLGEIVCFVTVSVSFVYGTLLGLFSGEKFYYKRKHKIDSQILRGSYPLCLAIFCFGFVIIYSHFFKDNVTILIAALASALVLAQIVVFYSVTRSNNREM